MNKNPHQIIKHRYVTEKARVLEALQFNEANPCIKKCELPKYVFVVDRKANKKEIAWAIESIYSHKNVKVLAVNTTVRKPRPRRVRGRLGKTSYLKKAIVTLQKGDTIDEQV